MASVAAPTHDNLLAAIQEGHPGAVGAECDGYGFVNITYDDKSPFRSRDCPACEYEKLLAALGRFTPPRFFDPVPVPAEATAWAQLGIKAQGLYITGPIGVGKTHVAWRALACWCVAAGVKPHGEDHGEMTGRIRPNVIFTRLVDLLDDLRPGDDSRVRVRDCQLARLLVIDDVGAEKVSEWTQERLYSIIDHRYAQCMPLMITSNLPASGLGAQVGDRTQSRLAEMCEVVAMTGEDRRWKP